MDTHEESCKQVPAGRPVNINKAIIRITVQLETAQLLKIE